MPVNLSIKNVPERIVRPLRARAKRNHRSLQGELMAILDEASQARVERKITASELHARIEALGLRTSDEATRMIREARDARSGR
jgi:antitoxin FitA